MLITLLCFNTRTYPGLWTSHTLTSSKLKNFNSVSYLDHRAQFQPLCPKRISHSKHSRFLLSLRSLAMFQIQHPKTHPNLWRGHLKEFQSWTSSLSRTLGSIPNQNRLCDPSVGWSRHDSGPHSKPGFVAVSIKKISGRMNRPDLGLLILVGKWEQGKMWKCLDGRKKWENHSRE